MDEREIPSPRSESAKESCEGDQQHPQFEDDEVDNPTTKILSKEEIWDDSAIIRAFDDALQFHSTKTQKRRRRKGAKRPMELLKEDLLGGSSAENTEEMETQVKVEQGVSDATQNFPGTPFSQPELAGDPGMASFPMPASDSTFADMAQPSFQDMEAALSEVMMAWYQAGYHTGRYRAMCAAQQRQLQQQQEYINQVYHQGLTAMYEEQEEEDS